jgi:hypothetical protein
VPVHGPQKRKTLGPGRRYLLLGYLFLHTALAVAGPQPDQDLLFVVGERFTYILKWGFIPAGEAVLEVLPPTAVNGETANHFVLTARSNAFVDPFYKVRDRIESFTDPAVTRSLHYLKRQQEGSTDNDIVVTFDWEAKTAQYSNYGAPIEPIALLPGSFDPLGALFFTRMADLETGRDVNRPVTDGKKNIIGQARIIRRESITVPAGTFDTYMIEPEMKDIGGVFRKSKNAKLHIWITADSRRMLVKLKSKVVVGSFVGELVSAEYPPGLMQASE